MNLTTKNYFHTEMNVYKEVEVRKVNVHLDMESVVFVSNH
jgi:hypothetical protein